MKLLPIEWSLKGVKQSAYLKIHDSIKNLDVLQKFNYLHSLAQQYGILFPTDLMMHRERESLSYKGILFHFERGFCNILTKSIAFTVKFNDPNVTFIVLEDGVVFIVSRGDFLKEDNPYVSRKK